MELGGFGAILQFALKIEGEAARFYEVSAQGKLGESFRHLVQGSHKRIRRLQSARQEDVVEMVLEPITGLDSDLYRMELNPADSEERLRCQAIDLEDVAIRFYRDASEKMPLPAVSRLFERLAKEGEQRKELLGRLFDSS